MIGMDDLSIKIHSGVVLNQAGVKTVNTFGGSKPSHSVNTTGQIVPHTIPGTTHHHFFADDVVQMENTSKNTSSSMQNSHSRTAFDNTFENGFFATSNTSTGESHASFKENSQKSSHVHMGTGINYGQNINVFEDGNDHDSHIGINHGSNMNVSYKK